MEYKIVKCSNQTAFEKEVQVLLNKGWRPQGGVTFNEQPPYTWFAQALVRETPPAEE